MDNIPGLLLIPLIFPHVLCFVSKHQGCGRLCKNPLVPPACSKTELVVRLVRWSKRGAPEGWMFQRFPQCGLVFGASVWPWKKKQSPWKRRVSMAAGIDWTDGYSPHTGWQRWWSLCHESTWSPNRTYPGKEGPVGSTFSVSSLPAFLSPGVSGGSVSLQLFPSVCRVSLGSGGH